MEQLELDFFEPVTLKMSFEDMFGKKGSDMPEQLRKQRWQEWKNLPNHNQAILESWEPCEPCYDCKHKIDDWCDLSGLPCSVNPMLSFRTGMIGLACMGMGFEERVKCKS